jgi:hypothetical protein
MAAYLKDPASNPPPANRIRSIKEYKDAIDSLTKLTDYVTKMTAPRDQAINNSNQPNKTKKLDGSHTSKEAALLAVLSDSGEE